MLGYDSIGQETEANATGVRDDASIQDAAVACMATIEIAGAENAVSNENRCLKKGLLPLDASKITSRLFLELASWGDSVQKEELLQEWKDNLLTLKQWLLKEFQVNCPAHLSPDVVSAEYDRAVSSSDVIHCLDFGGLSSEVIDYTQVNDLFDLIRVCEVSADNFHILTRFIYSICKSARTLKIS